MFLQLGAVAFDYCGYRSPDEQAKHRSFWQPYGWGVYPEGESFRKYWYMWLLPEFKRGVPVWIPFLAFAVPTAFLWYRDRRPSKGHCQQCGYDLTGNVSGKCPECGSTVTDDGRG